MPWFQVDDQLPVHRKVMTAGNAAMGLWVRAGSWCQQNLTGGFVPSHVVKTLGTIAQAKALVTADLWHDVKEGYRFHDWDEHQMSVEEIKARKQKRAEAGRKGGQASGQSRRGASAKADAEASASDLIEQEPQPNPTPVPDPVLPVVDLVGEVTQVDASEPSPQCNKHLNHTDPPPCHGCRKAREAHEDWHAGDFERRRLAREAAGKDRQAAIDACLACDEFGDITFEDSARKCNHQEAM